MIKRKRDAEICGNRKEKATREKLTVQLEKINQKALAKEGRLKGYRENRTFKTTKENSINNWEGVTRKQSDAKETGRFWTKVWQPKNITKRLFQEN